MQNIVGASSAIWRKREAIRIYRGWAKFVIEEFGRFKESPSANSSQIPQWFGVHTKFDTETSEVEEKLDPFQLEPALRIHSEDIVKLLNASAFDVLMGDLRSYIGQISMAAYSVGKATCFR